MCVNDLYRQLPFLGIQVEPVDLSVRAAGQAQKPLRPELSPARGDRRLWLLPLTKSTGPAAEPKVGYE
jgi:hypothetical protein